MPNVIDLFAGAGGLSLGAARAGFKITAAVERDKEALSTHRKNFPSSIHSNADISKLSGSQLLDGAGLKKGALDGLIGGPPCQGFSIMGRRSVADDRNDLFVRFFNLVKETSPKFFLAENVPYILNERYNDLRKLATDLVSKDYTLLNPIKITASDYGAPTSRTRIFFIGYRTEYFRSLSPDSFASPQDISPVYVRDALQGLPIDIDPNWQSEESGWQSFEATERNYFTERLTGNIPEGVGDPDSLEKHESKGQVSGCLGTRHTSDVRARYEALAPGKRDATSKSVKLVASGFCPTLRAGTGSDKGSYQAVRPIHHIYPRVITPREGARLQGFPDWFVFHPTKWHSFRQIGNSVSPLVSEHLLKVIHENLRE